VVRQKSNASVRSEKWNETRLNSLFRAKEGALESQIIVALAWRTGLEVNSLLSAHNPQMVQG
jgi:hypothetical protein